MTPLTRRDVLRLGAAASVSWLAGCGGVSAPVEAGDSTATASSCTADEVPAPDSAATDPRPYPAFPGELTSDSVETFVADFEQAYRYNTLLAAYPDAVGRTHSAGVRYLQVAVSSAGGLFSNEFTATVSGEEIMGQSSSDAEGTTPTPDAPASYHDPFEVTYRVTPSLAERAGTVVACQ